MVALPNPSFEPKTHWWRPGAVAPSREVPSQICAIVGQSSHFSRKAALVRVQNSQTKANGCYTPRALDFLATKGPLVPSNSTICPRNGPKRRQKAPKSAQRALAPETKNGPYLGLRGSKTNSEGT